MQTETAIDQIECLNNQAHEHMQCMNKSANTKQETPAYMNTHIYQTINSDKAIQESPSKPL